MKRPDVLWFSAGIEPRKHHAFEVDTDGRIDRESCCGRLDLDVEAHLIADEPARALAEFDTAPACVACLAVAELELPSLAATLLA